MQSTWDSVQDLLVSTLPRPDLQKVISVGVVRASGRIYLRAYVRKRRQTAAGMDRWTGERWVNNVHIESSLPASDPAWRGDVLTQAVLFARAVLPGFAAMAQQPAQATISLQSAPGLADPEVDVPVGTVHLYQLTDPSDDPRPRIESFAQPLLVITHSHHRPMTRPHRASTNRDATA